MKIKLISVVIVLSFARSVLAQDLLETYQLAVDNDPILKQAYLTQFSVAENKSQSIAQMLPTVSALGNSSRDRNYNKKANLQSDVSQHFWNHGFTINFSQPVFHWDHWVQLSQSDNRIAQAEAEYLAEQQNLMVRITEAYFNILSAQDNLQFTIAEKLAIERQLAQAKQRFEVGLIAITDVYEAQAGFDQSIADQINAENNLDDSKEILREIIGDNTVNLQILDGSKIVLAPPSPNNIVEWSHAAEVNNLNIIATLNQVEVARKNIAIQQSGHIPTLDIVANYKLQDINNTSGQRGDSQSLGLQLNIPLFQGGFVHSQAKQAQFDFQIAKEALLANKRLVKRQVRNAFRDVISSLSQVKALKATVTSSESSLEATEAGFEVGTRTMVDVLSEQRELYRAKSDFSRSRYDYLINGIRLKQTASSLTEEDLAQINQYLKQEVFVPTIKTVESN